nr:hypothetical protein GCM10025732_51500 [Glycomyces mayteni]
MLDAVLHDPVEIGEHVFERIDVAPRLAVVPARPRGLAFGDDRGPGLDGEQRVGDCGAGAGVEFGHGGSGDGAAHVDRAGGGFVEDRAVVADRGVHGLGEAGHEVQAARGAGGHGEHGDALRAGGEQGVAVAFGELRSVVEEGAVQVCRDDAVVLHALSIRSGGPFPQRVWG